MVKFISLIATFILTTCASTSTTNQPSAAVPKYELLLTGTVDGNAFAGVGIGSAAASHAMIVQSAIAVDYFTVESCHRSQQFNNIITEPWYSWFTNVVGTQTVKGFSWTYSEAPTIEDTGDCPLRFCAFSSTVGSPPVACAVIDFRSAKYAMPGTNICNGVSGPTSGTAICHTQVGLTERYQFPGPMVVAPQVTDPTGKTAPYWIQGQCVGNFVDTGETLWQYTVPQSECTIVFMEVAPPHRRAKLTVIPFTQALYGGS